MAATSGAAIAHNARAGATRVAAQAEAGRAAVAPEGADPAEDSPAVVDPVAGGLEAADPVAVVRAEGVPWARVILAPHAVTALAFRTAHANRAHPSPTSSIRMIMY